MVAASRAIVAAMPVPPAWRAYAGLLLRRRRGLPTDRSLPRIERSLDRFTIDPAWLAAYRDIVGLAPDAQAPLPPLSLQVAAAPLHLAVLADAAFPFRAWGLVHVVQRVQQWEATPASQTLSMTAFTADARPARRGTEFDLVTEVRADSRLVWRGTTTALARGPGRADAPLSRTETVADSALELTSRIALIPVPEDLGRRYAAIAGDLNPIHQHALLARPFGFQRAIVHGTWTLARALAAAGWPTTPAFELEARFRRPVLLPSTIEVMARRSAQGRELLVSGTERVEPHLQARLLRGDV